jgi:VanZ family protein
MGTIKQNQLLWGLVILWMALIFCFSAQPGNVSAHLSGGVVEVVVNQVVSNFSQLSPAEQGEITQEWSFIIRKSAHGMIYTSLGILVSLSLFQSFKTRQRVKITDTQRQMILALGICVLYAISDEMHQTLVIGRSGEVRDVLIDSTGALIGILITTFIQTKRLHRTKTNSENSI